MRDLEHAFVLFAVARKDFTALSAMTADPVHFADEIFGFHAQQASEKALKAWLAALGVEYPFRHDLGELLAMLQREGEDVERFWPLVDLTDFGVRFRYEAVDGSEAALNREETSVGIAALLEHVEKVLVEAGPV